MKSETVIPRTWSKKAKAIAKNTDVVLSGDEAVALWDVLNQYFMIVHVSMPKALQDIAGMSARDSNILTKRIKADVKMLTEE